MKRGIGIDLGVTSSSRIAVAEGATSLSNRCVRSTPIALVSAIEQASDGQPVDIIIESTAMTWFLAAVAAKRSGAEYTLHRVSGRKAAALRAFYRAHTKTDRIDAPVLARMKQVDDTLLAFTLPTANELALKRLVTYRQRVQMEATKAVARVRSLLHWAAQRALHAASGVTSGLVRVLRRWPDLRKLAGARVLTIGNEGGRSLEQARDLRQCIRDAVAFYGEHVDCGLIALEI